jgi:hypothetical protein
VAGAHIGNPVNHVKNSAVFDRILGSLPAGPQDIMVIFDVPLFTRVPIREAMSFLDLHFEEEYPEAFPPSPDILILEFRWPFYE